MIDIDVNYGLFFMHELDPYFYKEIASIITGYIGTFYYLKQRTKHLEKDTIGYKLKQCEELLEKN
jgi:hypothetical protein